MSPCVWSQRFLSIVCITGFRIRSAYIGFQVETEILIFEVIKRANFRSTKVCEVEVSAW